MDQVQKNPNNRLDLLNKLKNPKIYKHIKESLNEADNILNVIKLSNYNDPTLANLVPRIEELRSVMGQHKIVNRIMKSRPETAAIDHINRPQA